MNQVQVGTIDLLGTSNIVIDCPNCEKGITLNPTKKRHIKYRICPFCRFKIPVYTGEVSFSRTWNDIKNRMRKVRYGLANNSRGGKVTEISLRPGPIPFLPSFDIRERKSRFDKKKGGITE